jgi:hypothetical protein
LLARTCWRIRSAVRSSVVLLIRLFAAGKTRLEVQMSRAPFERLHWATYALNHANILAVSSFNS